MREKLTVGSCFSGIGGLELGLEWTGGFETKWQIENDPYASAVLKKHWPNVKRYGDIKRVHPDWCRGVDLICGGYPCQPFSLAGKRKGEKDSRHLWPYMYRIIRHVRPKYVLLENVPGHLSMGFGSVLGDLATCGYDAEWGVFSAAGVGAPHLRRRLFIIAHSTSPNGRFSEVKPSQCKATSDLGNDGQKKPMANAKLWPASSYPKTKRTRMESSRCSGQWKFEPDVGRVAHGVPRRMDRIRCLGNAVVPQVAQRIGEMILSVEFKCKCS